MNPKSRRIRARLMIDGHTVTSWAKSKGYYPQTVWSVIYRHYDLGKKLKGRLSRRILAELEEYLQR